MPLSEILLPVEMTLNCPSCTHALVKKGSWFQVAHHFRCESCRGAIWLSYPDKEALFERHAHLAPGGHRHQVGQVLEAGTLCAQDQR